MIDIIKNTNGVIFDSDVIIELYDKGKLRETLELFKKEKVLAYYPNSYSGEARRVDLDSYYYGNLLLDKRENDISLEIKAKLVGLPFDFGEAICYSIAEANNLTVLSNDKLAAFSYLVFKQKKQIIQNNIRTEELFEQFYMSKANSGNILPRLSSYLVFHNLLNDPELAENEKKSKPRDKEWFYAKDIAEENKMLNKLGGIEKQYLSVGAVAASIYALNPPSNMNASSSFHERKEFKYNVGLKIKSTTRDIENIVLVKKCEKKWAYNFIAYSAIIKYLKSCNFLIDRLKNSQGKYIGELSIKKLNKCLDFTKRFRRLFDSFRQKR